MKRKVLLLSVLSCAFILAGCGPTSSSESSSISSVSEGSSSSEGGSSVVSSAEASSSSEEGSSVVSSAEDSSSSEEGSSVVSSAEASSSSEEGSSVVSSAEDSSSPVVTNLSAAALESIQGSIHLDGGYQLQHVGETQVYTNLIQAVFTDSYYHNVEVAEDGSGYDNEVFKGADGLPYIYVRDLAENTVIPVRAAASQTEQYVWEDFTNPFNSLAVTDFTITDEPNVYALSNDKSTEVGAGISGWYETIDTFTVTVDSGEVTKINFTTAVISTGYDTYVSTYEFNVLARGGAVVTNPIPTPYPTTANHATLQAAIEATAQATSYTITHDETDPTGKYADVTYSIQYTEDAVYNDVNIEPEVPNGAVAIGDEVYEFTYADQTLVKGDYVGTGFESFRPTFDTFPYAILEDKGNGLFEAYSADVAAFVAPFFAENYNNSSIYEYATAFSIQIADGFISEINISYNCFGYILGDIVLTYSNINSTTIDIDFSSIMPSPSPSINEAYVGTWQSSDGEYTVVITADGTVTYNGTTVEWTTTEYGIEFVIGDVTYNLYYESNYDPVAFTLYDSAGAIQWELLSKQA